MASYSVVGASELSGGFRVDAGADTQGLLQRYPVTASGFHLIGKETERGWEQSEDISTLLPSLIRYHQNTSTPTLAEQERFREISLDSLQAETGLSRHTILRARRRESLHPKSLRLLRQSDSAKMILAHLNNSSRADDLGFSSYQPAPPHTIAFTGSNNSWLSPDSCYSASG